MIAESPSIKVQDILRDPKGSYWRVVGMDQVGGAKAKGPQALIVKGAEPSGPAVRVPMEKLKEWEAVQ
jgi:hypothetical protein